MEYRVMKVAELKPFPVRDIRANVVSKLTERIREGYNPARPLTVVEHNGNYIVADGNHRLKVLLELGIEEVPCLIRTGDPYRFAVECNADEDTYAPMDLFDWLSVLSHLKQCGFKGVEIADKLGWSPQKVSDYNNVLERLSATVLEIAKEHQNGRAEKKSAMADFTERWFRDSGLYALCEKYQLRFMEGFIADSCNWKKDKVQRETAKYKLWQDMVDIAKAELVNEGDLDTIVGLIENNSFRTIEQLKAKVRDLNEKAKDKLICGDAIVELEKLADGSIDLVITDPPYGIEYRSNHSVYNEFVTKEGLENDRLEEALELLDKTCEVLNRKTKADAHFYIFTSWKVYPEFKKIVEKYFTIKNMIVWNKGNASMGDLEGSWGNQHELIIFATKGRRTLNVRKFDILSVNRVPSTQAIHPTQKPVTLIKELLEASARPADTVCDPFMGSGSTIKAAKEFGNLNYIGIELDAERFEKAKAFIGGE